MRSVPPHTDDRRPRRLNRGTALQAVQTGLVAQLELFRSQFSSREYAVLLDLHRRWLEAELAREERALRRWAA